MTERKGKGYEEARLFDIGEAPLDPTALVYAFDPSRVTNADRVYDLANLGYLPQPVLDPTYGLGGMWERYEPTDLVTSDIARQADVRCDFTALPFRDGAFASCLFDPPYKMTGELADYDRSSGGSHDDIANRFATQSGNAQGVRPLFIAGMSECSRVTRRFLIVKCQDQIRSGYQWQVGEVVQIGERLGWRLEDQLHLSNYIEQPNGTSQRHARRNYSTFVVLRRLRST